MARTETLTLTLTFYAGGKMHVASGITHQEALDLEQHLHEALRRFERRRDVDETVDLERDGKR